MQTGAAYALDYMNNALDKDVKDAGRETMEYNIETDKAPVRYARIADAMSCDFCKMLASRGFVYRNKQTAGEFNQFHGGCNCQIVPGFDVDIQDNKKLVWRTSRSGRGYTQYNNSVRGKADVVIEKPEQIDKIVAKYDKQLADGKITQADYDAHVKAAREAFQNYDPNDTKLWEAYNSWAESYKPPVSKARPPSFTPNQATVATMDALTEEYTALIESADNVQDLNAIWRRVCNSTNRNAISQAQYDQLAAKYYENPNGFKVIRGGLNQG